MYGYYNAIVICFIARQEEAVSGVSEHVRKKSGVSLFERPSSSSSSSCRRCCCQETCRVDGSHPSHNPCNVGESASANAAFIVLPPARKSSFRARELKRQEQQQRQNRRGSQEEEEEEEEGEEERRRQQQQSDAERQQSKNNTRTSVGQGHLEINVRELSNHSAVA
jgi:hypothetical protein